MVHVLNSKQIKCIIDLLTPYMSPQYRHNYIMPWCINHSNLYSRISWAGADRTFTTQVVSLFLTHGSVEPNKTALQYLLETVREDMGLEDQAEINAILHAMQDRKSIGSNIMENLSPNSLPSPTGHEDFHAKKQTQWKNFRAVLIFFIVAVGLFIGGMRAQEIFRNQFSNANGVPDDTSISFAIESSECDNLYGLTGEELRRELATAAKNPQLREIPEIVEDDALESLVEKILCSKVNLASSDKGILFAVEINGCDQLHGLTGEELKRELATSVENPQWREITEIIEDSDVLELLVARILCPRLDPTSSDDGVLF